jgi:hypothetical protein
VGCSPGGSDPSPPPAALARAALPGAAGELHLKPAADALVRVLSGARSAYEERRRVRDAEEQAIRDADAQGPLDHAQLAELEKLERLRLADGVREAYEQVLVAAERTADALSAWLRSGGHGDGRDATGTLEEAWGSFIARVGDGPNAAIEAVRGEELRLSARVRETAARLDVPLPPEPTGATSAPPPDVEQVASQLAGASITDLVDAAIAMTRHAAGEAAPAQRPSQQAGKGAAGEGARRIEGLVRRFEAAIPAPLTPAERVRAHLVQGIRSRVDLRLKAYLERVDGWLRATAEERLASWAARRAGAMTALRSAVAERHAWSAALGDLEAVLQALDDVRRTRA